MQYGVQVYSVRDVLGQDFLGTLKQCKEIGYDSVELCGFGGKTPRELLDFCDPIGLKIGGNHESADAIKPERIEATIRFYKELGSPRLIIPGIDLSTRQKLDDFIALLNYAQPILEKEGLLLGYHNHSHEFLKTEYNAFIHEELQAKTRVNFEIDTFWAFNAGKDPLALLEQLRERIPVIHLKDGIKGGEGRSLGEGEAPVAAVRQKAISLGMDMVVESESLSPNGPEEITRCIKYLRSLD